MILSEVYVFLVSSGNPFYCKIVVVIRWSRKLITNDVGFLCDQQHFKLRTWRIILICVIGSSVLYVRKIFQKKHFLPPDAHNYVSIKVQENIFRKILPKCKTNDRYSCRHPKMKENKANCFGSVDCQASSGVFLKLPR